MKCLYKNIFYLSIYKYENMVYNKYCNRVNSIDSIKRKQNTYLEKFSGENGIRYRNKRQGVIGHTFLNIYVS